MILFLSFKKDEYEKVNGFDNWDSISAFDMDRLCQTIDSIQNKMKMDEENQYIIFVEGILLLEEQIASKFDIIFFIDIPKEVCRKRRFNRDEWIRENEAYFDLCVWPCYEKYGHYNNLSDKFKNKLVVLDGQKDIDIIAKEICDHIKSKIHN